MTDVCLLVVAKAPVPGLAKTRLAIRIGDAVAAEIAAASLLDTLDAVAATDAAARVVALTGDLANAVCADEVRCALDSFVVVAQRGADFAERLAHAHLDAAEATGCRAVVQIGMDTPQVNPQLLGQAAAALDSGDAVLGLARDGGWWVLGVADAVFADCLRTVPMSAPDTGMLTLKELRDSGLRVSLTQELSDVDTVEDIAVVRAMCHPGSRFHRVTEP